MVVYKYIFPFWAGFGTLTLCEAGLSVGHGARALATLLILINC